MSYRKITVNNKTYEYTIGKKFTKIKGVGIFENSNIGNPVVYFNEEYDHYSDREPSSVTTVRTDNFVVTPKTVAALIKGEPTPVNFGDSNSIEVMINPFISEIYRKTGYLPVNYKNYCYLRDDI